MNLLGPSGHMDTFARDNLPLPELWPDILPGPTDYPERLNVGFELCDRMVQTGFGDRVALIGRGGRCRTYREMADWTNRLARTLCEDFGLKPGNRVLIRSANNPAMVSCWLAATKAGAVAVHALPDLPAGELAKIVDKARIRLALCDTRMMDEDDPVRQEKPIPRSGHRLRRHRQSGWGARPDGPRQAGPIRRGADRP